MRTLLSFSVVSAALLSSIATSPPVFSVYERVKGKHTVDRGDDLELGIDLRANAEALPSFAVGPLPAPEPDPAPEPPDRAPADLVDLDDSEALEPDDATRIATSELEIALEIDSQGSFGSAVDTEVFVALWLPTPDGDVLIEEVTAEVPADETLFLELFAPGVFSTCDAATDCIRNYVMTLEQTGDGKLRVKHAVAAHIRADIGSSAPREADIDIDVYEL